jgi:phosphatidylglycerol---prolipoprotein diacylglyceryl transferase
VTLASIPSPHAGTVNVGPLVLHMYGLMLLLAIAACIALTGYRWTRRGGDWDLVMRVAVWGVAAGVVGARLYHDITSWNEVPTPKWKGIFEVWEGGLGVWGGILLGCIVGAIVVHRAGESAAAMADAVAPGLLLAQAIGRWGNWWNQELFGKPTSLPWGLRIDPAHRPFKYAQDPTFHPTFLYEFVYDLVGVGLLLLLDRRYRFHPPALFSLYVSYYTFGRTFEEFLRVDPSHHVFGLRINAVVSMVVFVVSTAFFVYWQFIKVHAEPEPPVTGPPPPDEPPQPPKQGRRWSLRRRGGEEAKAPKMAIPKGRVRPSR